MLAGRLARGRGSVFTRFRTFLSGLRSRPGGGGLLVFLNQAAHGIRWLGAFADPILGPINIERTVPTGLVWIVRANDLDEFPVARAATVGYYHSVVGPVFTAFSA